MSKTDRWKKKRKKLCSYYKILQIKWRNDNCSERKRREINYALSTRCERETKKRETVSKNTVKMRTCVPKHWNAFLNTSEILSNVKKCSRVVRGTANVIFLVYSILQFLQFGTGSNVFLSKIITRLHPSLSLQNLYQKSNSNTTQFLQH